MATYPAIAATSNAVRLLLENAAATSEWSDTAFELFQADELQDPISASKSRVSIYLYRVVISTVRRDRGPRIAPDGRIFPPSLPVDLHYLVTSWSADAVTAHRLLGWTFVVLQETPIIPAALLNAYQDGVFEEQETVEFCWNPLPPADLSDLWQVASIRADAVGHLHRPGRPPRLRRSRWSRSTGQCSPVRLRHGASMTALAGIETIERLAHRNALARPLPRRAPRRARHRRSDGAGRSSRIRTGPFPAVRTPSGRTRCAACPGSVPGRRAPWMRAGLEDVGARSQPFTVTRRGARRARTVSCRASIGALLPARQRSSGSTSARRCRSVSRCRRRG